MISYLLYTISIIIIFISKAVAQDSNYWSQQFGSRAALLGGAMVAGTRDVSEMYYNPGALSLLLKSVRSITANAYKIENIQMADGAGKGVELVSTRLSIFPQFVAGSRRFSKDAQIWLGYGILTRNQNNVRAHIRTEFMTDILKNIAGNELYIGTFEYQATLNEVWLPQCLSYRLNPNLGIGITQFIAYRNQTQRVSANAQAIPLAQQTPPLPIAGHTDASDIIAHNFSLIWKFGIAHRGSRWRWGACLTLPAVNVFSNFQLLLHESLYNLGDYLPEPIYGDFLMSFRSKQLKSQIKTPLSISAGITYKGEKETIYMVSAEYFARILPYPVLRKSVNPFIYTENPEVNTGRISQFQAFAVAKPIFNIAFGIEDPLNEKIVGMIGFRTDFNNLKGTIDQLSAYAINRSQTDLYHLSGGVSYHKNKTDITVGFNFSYGLNKRARQLVNITEPEATRFLFGELQNTARTTVRSVTLIFGFIQYLNL
jgi:hypothetical protein